MEDTAKLQFLKLQSRLGGVAYQLTQFAISSHSPPTPWYPPLNVFLCDGRITVCVELAGVDPGEFELSIEPRSIRIRGKRRLPEPCGNQLRAREILAMEIDYGPFERRLEFPLDVEPSRSQAEQRNGILWIELPLRDEA